MAHQQSTAISSSKFFVKGSQFPSPDKALTQSLYLEKHIKKQSKSQLNHFIKGIRRYTLQIFLERAKIVHGSKYNYSGVTSSYIRNKYSKVPVVCNTCLRM